MKTIVRFAPSPTANGSGLHIGGLRTILFNYLFAKQNNGYIICRIEDTDEQRSNDDCLKRMIKDWSWAGIEFDAGFKLNKEGEIEEFNTIKGYNFGPMRQSKKTHIYNQYTERLLMKDKAYRKDGAVFFKMPKKDIVYYDSVLGEITLPANDCQDFVIRKASGMPSFYMAMTCDDYQMGVNMIIRGFEHVNTNFRQIALQEALGLPRITCAHVPLIFNSDGTKMSKRQSVGQVNVQDFRKDGYLPEAILNYIATLGWNPGKQEVFDMKYMINNFSLGAINYNNARFDYKKLDSINSQYMKNIAKTNVKSYITEMGYKKVSSNIDHIMEYIVPRCKTLKMVAEQSSFLLNKEVEYDKSLLANINKDIINIVIKLLKDTTWDKNEILNKINGIVQDGKYKMGDVASSIRFAITGQKVSPPIHDSLYILGKELAIKRLAQFAD